MMWVYRGEPFNEADAGDAIGFVYIIRHETSGKYYIVQKKFKFIKTLPPLKNQKRKRKVISSSDWRSYYGSSTAFNEYVQQCGMDKFKRTIIHLCNAKSEMNYIETITQLRYNVLFDEDSFNGIINCRISSKHIVNSEMCKSLSTTINVINNKDKQYMANNVDFANNK